MENFNEDEEINGDHSALISFLQPAGCRLSLDGVLSLTNFPQLQVDMVNQGLMLHGLDMVDVPFDPNQECTYDCISYFASTLTLVWGDTGASQLAL